MLVLFETPAGFAIFKVSWSARNKTMLPAASLARGWPNTSDGNPAVILQNQHKLFANADEIKYHLFAAS